MYLAFGRDGVNERDSCAGDGFPNDYERSAEENTAMSSRSEHSNAMTAGLEVALSRWYEGFDLTCLSLHYSA